MTATVGFHSATDSPTLLGKIFGSGPHPACECDDLTAMSLQSCGWKIDSPFAARARMTSIFSKEPAGCGQDADANGRSGIGGFGLGKRSGVPTWEPSTVLMPRCFLSLTSQPSSKLGKISTPVHRSVFAIRQVRISAAMPLKSILPSSVAPLGDSMDLATHAT